MLISLCALTLLPSKGQAESATKDSSWFEQLLQDLGASETVDVSQGIDWGVLPGPFVNPEMGLGLGIAAIGLYGTDDWQVGDPISTLALKGFVSSNGSYGVGLENRSYLADDQQRILADFWISKEPKYYYGVGYELGQNLNNETLYDALSIKFTPRFAQQILPETYLIIGWDGQILSQQSFDGPMEPENTATQYSSAVVLGVEFDSRDFEPNPYSGRFVQVNYSQFTTAIGSDQNFSQLIGNWREYYQLSNQDVVAAELYIQSLWGDVPWYRLAELGSDKRMRGYYQGQYRDKQYVTTQIEYRQHLWGRHGVVYWLGAGVIASSFEQLNKQPILPNFGIGYRFSFKSRVNVRLDMGFGRSVSGFYFHINEAF